MTIAKGKFPIFPMVVIILLGLAVISEGPGQPARQSEPTTNADQLRPMPRLHEIKDPEEATETWNDYIWADSMEEAVRKCNQEAERLSEGGRYYIQVVRVTKVGSGKKYSCEFET